MQEVWIFGDSYVDKHYIGSQDNYTWPGELEKKYVVKNFGKSGTGPGWSLNQLLSAIANSDKNCNDIILIFFVSEIFRLDLSFFNSADQTLIYNFLTNNNNIRNEFFDKKKIQYKQWIPFIEQLWSTHLSTDSFKQTELLKIIGALQLISTMFKKTLVWPCFDKLPLSLNLNNDNFCLIDFDLISLENTNYGYCKDPRINHLNEQNHKIMFTHLCDWIEHNRIITASDFI